MESRPLMQKRAYATWRPGRRAKGEGRRAPELYFDVHGRAGTLRHVRHRMNGYKVVESGRRQDRYTLHVAVSRLLKGNATIYVGGCLHWRLSRQNLGNFPC